MLSSGGRGKKTRQSSSDSTLGLRALEVRNGRDHRSKPCAVSCSDTLEVYIETPGSFCLLFFATECSFFCPAECRECLARIL